MGGRRSLADELAELINPMPKDLDPEAHDHDTSARLPGHDEQLEALTADVGRARGGRLPLRAGIAIEDEAYRGKKTSRSALFPDQHEEDHLESQKRLSNGLAGQKRARGAQLANGHFSGSGSEGDEGDASGSEDADEFESGDVDEGDEFESGTEDGDGEVSDDMDGEGDEDDEGGTEEGSSGDDTGEDDEGELGTEVGEDNEELAALEANYRQLQEREQLELGAIKEKGKRDVVKGQATRQQQVLYERTLELRILLQKALMGSNRLPTSATTSHVLDLSQLTAPPSQQHQTTTTTQTAQNGHGVAAGLPKESLAAVQDLGQRLRQLRETAAGTLSQLVELQDAIVGCSQSLCHGLVDPQPAAAASATSDALWQALDTRFQALSGFRDVSLDKWHARAVLTSGSATLQGSLKALNQSISRQVATMMRDPHKLVQRCRLLKSVAARLGERPTHPEDSDSDDPDARPPSAADRDEETFDDGEFYQQLLKEFLEQGGAGGGLSGARPPKKRKVVDRRASKGRKIRYNVQDKLVNFMSAVPMEAPVFAEQLFANLFSSGVTKAK